MSHVLPVVEHRQRFVGTISLGVLERVLARWHAPPAVPDREGLTGLLASSLWRLCDDLLRAAVSLLPADGRAREGRS